MNISILEVIIYGLPICEGDMLLWLSRGDVKAETESGKIAAQDQPLKTNCHATKISKTYQTLPHNISRPSTGKITVHKET